MALSSCRAQPGRSPCIGTYVLCSPWETPGCRNGKGQAGYGGGGIEKTLNLAERLYRL